MRKTAKNEEQANEANAYFAKQDEAKLSKDKQSQANQAIDIDINRDIDIDIDVHGTRVWGLTARIVKNLVDTLEE